MPDTDKIKSLNDKFRQSFSGGKLFMTAGIVGRSDVSKILAKVALFDTFGADNDPYGEHDFGAFDVGHDTIYWKIDYYDREMVAGSPDPSDPNQTTRVLTVMLAEEY